MYVVYCVCKGQSLFKVGPGEWLCMPNLWILRWKAGSGATSSTGVTTQPLGLVVEVLTHEAVQSLGDACTALDCYQAC